MYVCMYVCTYACMHVCMYVGMSRFLHVYKYRTVIYSCFIYYSCNTHAYACMIYIIYIMYIYIYIYIDQYSVHARKIHRCNLDPRVQSERFLASLGLI